MRIRMLSGLLIASFVASGIHAAPGDLKLSPDFVNAADPYLQALRKCSANTLADPNAVCDLGNTGKNAASAASTAGDKAVLRNLDGWDKIIGVMPLYASWSSWQNGNALAKGMADFKHDADVCGAELEEALRSKAAPEKSACNDLVESSDSTQTSSPQAGAITYDLGTDEGSNSGGSNPEKHWAFLSAGDVVPFNTIPQPSGSCLSQYPGITTDWSAGNVSGNCIPAFAVASGTGPGSPADFLAGDVVLHSQDDGNGSANGQASITWTAPATGTITVAGVIWYAQSAQERSNDFTLTLGGSNTLASGTVAYNSAVGNSRANPLRFTGGGTLSITAGEVLALEIQKSAGQPYGSVAGINLTVIETAAP